MKRIELTKGRTAQVDDEDLERLSLFSWFAYESHAGVWYAARYTARDEADRRQIVLMHRAVLGLVPGDTEVDHRDHDGLNNQKANLRLATRATNSHNRRIKSGGFVGVYFHKQRQRWQARIKQGGKNISLGMFDTPEEAARARDAACLDMRGEFAVLNYPLEDSNLQPADS